MDAASVWLGRELLRRLDDAEGAVVSAITSGAVADFPQYKMLAGKYAAYQAVRGWLQEASLIERKEQNGADRPY